MCEDHQGKRHSLSSESLKGKYDLQTEMELDEEVLSTHKGHDSHRRERDSGTESDSSVDRHEKNIRACTKCFQATGTVNDRFRKA